MAAEYSYVYSDGSPVPQGFCVMPDHWEQVFVVRVRSQRRLPAAYIQSIIQNQHEVVTIDEKVEEGRCVVRGRANPAVERILASVPES